MSKAIRFNFEQGKAEVKESINIFYEEMASDYLKDLKHVINGNNDNASKISELEDEIKDIKGYLYEKQEKLVAISNAKNLQQVLKVAEGLPMCEMTILSFFTGEDFIED